MRRWAWAAVVVLLGPQLVLLGGVGARREAQRTQQPGQRADPPNATASASSREGLPEAPKPSQASGPEFSDAHMTWLNFVRRPDDSALRKRCGSRDKKPRDLFGPPGPPGAEVTTETLLHEFQELLKEATERRFSGLLDPLLPQGPGLRLVGEAFHCRLQGPRRVDKRTLVELHGFQAPAAQGAFLRGSGLSLASGRFTAPVSGIFQFSASLHVGSSPWTTLGGAHRPQGSLGTGAGLGPLDLQRLPLALWGCVQVPGGRLRPGEQQQGLHSTGAGAAAAAGWTVRFCVCGQWLRGRPHHPGGLQLLRAAPGHVRAPRGAGEELPPDPGDPPTDARGHHNKEPSTLPTAFECCLDVSLGVEAGLPRSAGDGWGQKGAVHRGAW
ncbi:adipolin isoform X1 [Pan paniscus]|uniref:adipolin isoform X1 n=1 Tax=Pan paniscus TaxID=9597 RepID=UPI003006FE03